MYSFSRSKWISASKTSSTTATFVSCGVEVINSSLFIASPGTPLWACYRRGDGKDDVLASDYKQFFDFVADACMQREGDSIRIAPMAFMLSHLSEGRFHDFYRGLRASGKLAALRMSAVDRLSAKFDFAFRHLPGRLRTIQALDT